MAFLLIPIMLQSFSPPALGGGGVLLLVFQGGGKAEDTGAPAALEPNCQTSGPPMICTFCNWTNNSGVMDNVSA